MATLTHFLKSLRLVLYSFFGVRKKVDLERDTKISPLFIIMAGFVGVIAFVSALILIVKAVV